VSDSAAHRLARLVRRLAGGGRADPFGSRAIAASRNEPRPRRAVALLPPPPRYPAFRLATLGPVDGVPTGISTTDLHARPPASGPIEHDVLLVPGVRRGGPSRLDDLTRRWLLACEERGIPTVLVSDHLDDLRTEVAAVCRYQATWRPAVAAAATAAFGETAVIPLPLAVDTSRFHPRPHDGRSSPIVLVVDDGSAGPVTEGLGRELPWPVGTVPGQLADRDPATFADRFGGGPAIAVAPLSDAPSDAWRAAVALAALGHPLVGRADASPLPDLLVGDSGQGLSAAVRQAARLPPDRVRALVRAALLHHSPAGWLDTLVSGVGLPAAPSPRVTALVPLRGDRSLEQVEATLAVQVGIELDAVLLSPVAVARSVEQRVTAWQVPARVLATEPHHTLGDRLNLGADRAGGEFIAVLDDAARYDPNHLLDLTIALDVAAADAVGRAERYVHDPERGVIGLLGAGTALRADARPAMGTLLLRRETALRFGFLHDARTHDELLTARIRSAGGIVYAAAPEGTLLRGRVPADHPVGLTWPGDATVVALPGGDGPADEAAPADQTR
jgi:hypothetical protein